MAGRYLVRIFSDMEIEAENEKEAIQTFKDLHIESDNLTPFISAKYLGETKKQSDPQQRLALARDAKAEDGT